MRVAYCSSVGASVLLSHFTMYKKTPIHGHTFLNSHSHTANRYLLVWLSPISQKAGTRRDPLITCRHLPSLAMGPKIANMRREPFLAFGQKDV